MIIDEQQDIIERECYALKHDGKYLCDDVAYCGREEHHSYRFVENEIASKKCLKLEEAKKLVEIIKQTESVACEIVKIKVTSKIQMTIEEFPV